MQPGSFKRASLPPISVTPNEGECFDCHVAFLLITFYERLKGRYTTHQEIAEAMGIERSSLYVRLRRARTLLKSCPSCHPKALKVVKVA
jgi:hypothetical protein